MCQHLWLRCWCAVRGFAVQSLADAFLGGLLRTARASLAALLDSNVVVRYPGRDAVEALRQVRSLSVVDDTAHDSLWGHCEGGPRHGRPGVRWHDFSLLVRRTKVSDLAEASQQGHHRHGMVGLCQAACWGHRGAGREPGLDVGQVGACPRCCLE